MYINHNMTAREALRIHGTVPLDKLEDLLDREDALKEVQEIDANLKEAMAQYPAEDFLQTPINRLHELAKRLRNENRQEVLAIIGQLDDIAQCTFYAADYGRDELRKALKTVEDTIP